MGRVGPPLTDSQKTLSMGAIAVAPTNPKIIYAGTGEANNSPDSNYGRGILVSSNGGKNWKLHTGPGDIFSKNRLAISQISVDPNDPNVAYAAVANAFENGGGRGTGIYRTKDGGTTWTNMTEANGKDSNVNWSAVVVDPNNTNIVYAALSDPVGESTSEGVYISWDYGVTWFLLWSTPSGSGIGRIALAISPTSQLYVAASEPGLSGGPGPGLKYFGRSDNPGGNEPLFTDLTSGTPNFLGSQGTYDIAIGVDPQNPAIVYASGQIDTDNKSKLVILSTDSGRTWSDISGTENGIGPHTDSHAMAFDASGRMLLGTDGGIYRYDPVSNRWADLNGNLETIQFTGIGLHPTDPFIVIGGSQDNGTGWYNGNIGDRVWTQTDGGDGGFAKFSQTNGNRAYHMGPYGSFGDNFFRRSDDEGYTWVTKTSGLNADAHSMNFYAPFVVDPNNGDHVLFGANKLWETYDGGDTWNSISEQNGNIYTIGLANSNDSATIYYSTEQQIWVTTDHGGSWTPFDPGRPLNLGGTVDIQVDPADAQTAYAVVGFFNNIGQVFKTTNGGSSWQNISGNLHEPVWSLQIDPTGALYVGADDGVYATTDGGTTWSRFGTGLPYVQVVQLELNSKLHILGAATHGRGMWEIKTASGHWTTHLLVSAPSTATAGKAISFKVTALDASNLIDPNYTGTVHFTSTDVNAELPPDGKLTKGKGTLSATLNTSGIQTITATDTVTSSITGTSNKISVTGLKTTTNIRSSETLSNFGDSVTFTATVTGSGGTPTGSVLFTAAGTQYEWGATLAGGTATISTSLPAGKYTIWANYLGDGHFEASSGSLSQTVKQAQTKTVVSSSGNPSIYGQPVTFTATVSDGVGYTPGGTVQFLVDNKNFGQAVSLSGGTASIQDPLLTVGNHTVTANYIPDGNHLASSGVLSRGQNVNPIASTTTVTSSGSPSALGQSVTFMAVVTAGQLNTGRISPTGTVQFMVGGTSFGQPVPLSGGSASIQDSSLTVGNHSVSAVYSGDTNFTTSTGTLSGGQTVKQVSSTTAVSSNPNPSTFGQSVTFTATVTGSGGTPTGTVQFSAGTSSIGSAPLSNGTATVSTSSLPAGNNTITAAYSGDNNYGMSTGILAGGQTVKQAETSTSVSSSENPSNSGDSITFTATVNGGSGGNPTGNVQFVIDGANFGPPVSLSTKMIVPGHYTTLATSSATSSLTAGNHTITANYLGDNNFTPSSGVLSRGQTVKASSTTGVVSSFNPSIQGESITFSAVVSGVASVGVYPTGTVQFQVDGNNFGAPVPLVKGLYLIAATSQATSTLAVGTHTVTATYSGDNNFMGSSGTLSGGQIVNPPTPK
jgi:hypothetical protein